MREANVRSGYLADKIRRDVPGNAGELVRLDVRVLGTLR
jgi:hypothetical protein